MDKKNRPVDRQKRIGSGTGSVQKRGSGLGSGPVGNRNAYADRNGGSSRGGSRGYYSGGRRKSG